MSIICITIFRYTLLYVINGKKFDLFSWIHPLKNSWVSKSLYVKFVMAIDSTDVNVITTETLKKQNYLKGKWCWDFHIIDYYFFQLVIFIEFEHKLMLIPYFYLARMEKQHKSDRK